MTTVTIFKSKEGTYQGFTCEGHAGYAKAGRDIVCAAISVVIINTINSIEEIAGQVPNTKYHEATGYIDCKFPFELNDRSITVMDSMVLGLENIKQQYGKKHLNLIFEEV